MNKALFLLPAAFVIAGAYLLMVSLGGGETVQLFYGDEVPRRFTLLLGGISVFGAIVIGVEMVARAKKPTAARHSE
ncbi:MAG: hypothetical protein HYY35_03645 [Deltaproteobacteria bacterium]|nr:hypothetical protein [Deltaproteobacteria bacterium]